MNRQKQFPWDTIIYWLVLTAIGAAMLLAAQTEKANAQEWCPPGHQLVIEREGPYYVYTPNQPAGYSAVWVNNNVTLFPPPGTYGEIGDTVRVCYTDDIHAYADQIGWPTVTPVEAPKPDLRCWDPQTGEEGLRGATGECWTATLYDQRFSAEHLATVPHQGDPSKSVADVYGLTPQMDAESKPSTRTRTFTYPGGVTVYSSFVDIIKKAQAI